VNCIAYGITAATWEAIRAAGMLTDGILTLDDLDLHYLEATEVVAAQRGRILRERAKARTNG
jgi:hypothetical protein